MLFPVREADDNPVEAGQVLHQELVRARMMNREGRQEVLSKLPHEVREDRRLGNEDLVRRLRVEGHRKGDVVSDCHRAGRLKVQLRYAEGG